jgi:pantoate--beta-alanine ligase
VIRDAAGFRRAADAARSAGRDVALVPTMGALHEGHASLLRRARADRSFVAMSLFVNPLQFGSGEDFERYPRDEAADLAVARRLGVDVAWAPTVEEMYPPDRASPPPDPGPIGDVLEGAARPGHFAGVLAAVRRLLEVCGACATYLGEKDAQQLFLVRKMVNELDDLRSTVTVVGCPIVREADGLALSSRNAYLSTQEREAAGCLFLALSEAAAEVRAGERDVGVLRAVMAREIGATPLARPEYTAVVDEATFASIERVEGPARALVAAWIGHTRLIDNLRLSSDEPVGHAEPAPGPGMAP